MGRAGETSALIPSPPAAARAAAADFFAAVVNLSRLPPPADGNLQEFRAAGVVPGVQSRKA